MAVTPHGAWRRPLTQDSAGLLCAGGQPLKLPPKERAVLLLLLNSTSAVRKETFAQCAWADGEMSDEALARCISRLRRALHPHGLQIEAVYGLGYQLVESADSGAAVSAAVPDVATLDSYQHARQLLQQRTPAAMNRAIELLRGLIREQPGFAAARVALGDALALAVGWGLLPTEAAVDEGLAALSGLVQDASSTAVPGLMAAQGTLLDMSWRFEEAGRCHAAAMAHDAQSAETLLAFARHQLFVNQPETAVAMLQRVRLLTPHALHVRMLLARALVQSGQGPQAVVEAQAAMADHPGQLVVVAFSLSMQALVAPQPDLEAAALRLTQGPDAPPFAWTVAAYVLARLQRREDALDIVETALLCTRVSAGEAALYAAPLAALGEFDRALALLHAAVQARSGMMAMVLRDPAHAHWLPQHPAGRALLETVFGDLA